MNELALFAGAGGGLLGSLLFGLRPVCAVEIEPFCREVLLRRQRDRVLPLFPLWDDVRTFAGRPWRGLVDVVTGGFPCQPWSVAGRRRGSTDDRNLWPDTIRIIREVGPQFCLLENVPGLKSKPYFGQILADLASSGFDVRWDCIPASALGAPHQRDRLWILAYPNRRQLRLESRGSGGPCGSPSLLSGDDGPPQFLAHPTGDGRKPRRAGDTPEGSGGRQSGRGGGGADRVANHHSEGQLQPAGCEPEERGRPRDSRWWDTEPAVGRVAHGVAHRVDRLRALGNGQVPGVAHRALRDMMERLHDPA